MGTEMSGVSAAGALAYGTGPVAAAGGVALLSVLGVLCSGVGMFSDTTPVTASPPGIQATEPAPTTEGGTGPAPTEGTAPGSDVPTAPPERKSAPETTHETYRVHWIQWGDTLSQISVDSGVSVQRLAEVNGISNVDLIYADDQLLIPYLLIPVE